MKLNFIAYAGPEYQSRANVLAESIRRWHPDASFLLESHGQNAPTNGYIKDFHKKKYTDILNMLLAGAENVVFIGSDCEIFSRLIELENALEDHDVVLIPHCPFPLRERSSMISLYASGHINSDCIGFRNSPNTLRILRWLCSVVGDETPSNGVFYDQTWLSSLPFTHDNVHILRHPGYNKAYWLDTIDLNDIRFFHYSGFVKGALPRISKHSTKVVDGNLLTFYQAYDNRI